MHRIWYRLGAFVLVLAAIALGYFVVYSQPQYKDKAPTWLAKYPFSLGLDLAGGTELTYRADLSQVAGDQDEAMSALRSVIENRVNLFGVTESVVQVQRSGAFGGGAHELRVELPGITNVAEAVKKIGETPTLEFKLANEEKIRAYYEMLSATTTKASESEIKKLESEAFITTGLNGRYLERASIVFDQRQPGLKPIISIQFNSEGAAKFEQITKENVGKPLAIFLDGKVISSPVIQEAITGGTAQITGQFSIDEAKELVRNLNYGALPVPITLASTQSVGAYLGTDAVHAGLYAGLVGVIILALFMVLWYRLPGLIAVLALSLYVLISLSLFKFIPVTLTAAGIAGFILSVGMAVDANVLIFERSKEELRKGRTIRDAIHEGFTRAWLSIRDSNISSIITAIVLFWLGTSSVKGFALTLGLGVLVSMFSAITASRTLLLAITPLKDTAFGRFLFSNGFGKQLGADMAVATTKKQK